MTLVQQLPLVIGDKIPEEVLITITKLSPRISYDTIAFLRILIEEKLSTFSRLYHRSLSLKNQMLWPPHQLMDNATLSKANYGILLPLYCCRWSNLSPQMDTSQSSVYRKGVLVLYKVGPYVPTIRENCRYFTIKLQRSRACKLRQWASTQVIYDRGLLSCYQCFHKG